MKKLIKILTSLLFVTALLVAIPIFVVTITAFFGGMDWRLDLTSHFRPLYLLAEIVLLAFFTLLRRKWLSLVTLLLLLLNASQILPLYLPQVQRQTEIWLKIVQFNVCAPKKDFSPTSHFLLSEQPDLVVLEECNERCFNDLKKDQVLKAYPYSFRKVPFRHRLFVLSKYPLTVENLPNLQADPAIALLKLSIRNQPINLLVMHSTRPSSGASYYRNQIEQFKEIAKLTHSTQGPFLMVGDLNVSPWSYSFRLLMQKSRLRNSMIGFGIQSTFPTFIPHYEQVPIFPIIPIDHVLISPEFTVMKRYTGPKLQSDHLPVVVNLGLKDK